ncbi:GspH/FimT family pseudopilin [Pseudoxanthomonas sp. UC19_8]|uniref:GspH/FimT family pseudopilin n=1 Tax=Pseudoxanthomonas sp. UC19_8 TaxID=3350175 RepID=UPI0036D372F5
MGRRSQTRGFTLLELMVTVAVMAILAAIAFPSFQNTIRSTRVATASNQVLAAIALARTEAIKSRAAGLCPSANATSCSGNWSDGWLVWQDLDRNGNLDGTEPIVSYSSKPSGITVTGGEANQINFDARGRATGRDSSNTALTGGTVLTISSDPCPSGQRLRNVLTVNPSGQVTREQVNCP